MQDIKKVVFSIIIPNYNRVRVISKAVNSVLAQNFIDFELIVVDDCSTDNSIEILSRIKDERLKVLKLTKNSGAAAARNYGIQKSTGTYISLLDSDDYYEPQFLQRTFSNINNTNKKVGFCWTGVRYFEGEQFSEFTWQPEVKKNTYNTLLHSLHIGTNSGITFKREVFNTSGYFNEELPAAEDTEFFLRVSKSYDFLVIPEVLINIERDNPDRLSKDLKKIAKAYNIFIHSHREEIDKDKTLQLKYYYKLMWLNYHLGDKRKARKYYSMIPKINPASIKTFIVKNLYENLPLSIAYKFHKKMAS